MDKFSFLSLLNPFKRPSSRTVLVYLSVTISFALYLFITHRIRTFVELVEFTRVVFLPEHDDRCRIDHYSYSTERLKCLPNVLFLGASKCGTTSMADYLDQHPLVHSTKRFVHRKDVDTQKDSNEVHLFDRGFFPYAFPWIERMTEYASSPPIPIALKDPPHSKSSSSSATFPIVIHYTPQYVYAPTVPFEIETVYPPSTIQNMKYIIMLRDPIERALSSYWFKSSHLFTSSHEDKGSLDDFKKVAMEEIELRRKYDICMKSHHDKYKAYYVKNPIQAVIRKITGDKVLRTPSSSISSTTSVDDNNSSTFTTTTTTATSFTINNEESNNDEDDDDEMAWAIERLSYSQEPAMIQLYTEIKQSEFKALQTCFGNDMFRAKSLGLRHIDKGIYIDQIERWFLNHPRKYYPLDDKYMKLLLEERLVNHTQDHNGKWNGIRHKHSQNFFIITLEEFEAAPEKWYHRLLDFLEIGDTAEISSSSSSSAAKSTTTTTTATVDFTHKSLEKPNKLSSSSSSSSASNITSSSKKGGGGHSSRLDPEFKAMLMEFYRPYNRRLEKLLGRSLHWGY